MERLLPDVRAGLPGADALLRLLSLRHAVQRAAARDADLQQHGHLPRYGGASSAGTGVPSTGWAPRAGWAGGWGHVLAGGLSVVWKTGVPGGAQGGWLRVAVRWWQQEQPTSLPLLRSSRGSVAEGTCSVCPSPLPALPSPLRPHPQRMPATSGLPWGNAELGERQGLEPVLSGWHQGTRVGQEVAELLQHGPEQEQAGWMPAVAPAVPSPPVCLSTVGSVCPAWDCRGPVGPGGVRGFAPHNTWMLPLAWGHRGCWGHLGSQSIL